MHFNFHLSGDESPEQSRRIANAVLALGGLTSLVPETVNQVGKITYGIHLDTSQATAAICDLADKAASANVSVGYRVTEGATPGARWAEEDESTAPIAGMPSDLPPRRYTSYAQATGAPLIPEPMSTNELRDLISSPSVPPVPTTPADETKTPLTDHNGLPWDERIHSSNRKLNADCTWRYRKNVPDETKQAVEAELRGMVQAPLYPSTPAQLAAIRAEPVDNYSASVTPPVPPVPTIEVTAMAGTVYHVPAAPPVPTGALQRTYSDVVNLIMARKVQPDTYMAILGMSLPEFAKHVISAPNDATLMFDALDKASRS